MNFSEKCLLPKLFQIYGHFSLQQLIPKISIIIVTYLKSNNPKFQLFEKHKSDIVWFKALKNCKLVLF
jgi:hypothetical protein